MEKLNVLVVDDSPNVEKAIREGLQKIGIDVQIDLMVPYSDEEKYPFGCEHFPLPSELDKYDLAFIDLELNPDKRHEGLKYRAEDLGGGTIILPYLRQNAPWLPVFAHSRLYLSENIENHFISVASSFGFDGQITRMSFKSLTFNRNLFDALFKNAQFVRLQSCMATIPTFDQKYPEIESSFEVDESLKRIKSDWKAAFRKLFWFAGTIVLEKGKQGFSGSLILKVFSRLPLNNGGEESQWIVKISSSPSKLHQEISAHLKMLRKGLNHAMLVPLLWPSVIRIENISAIGYSFAKDVNPASNSLGSINDAFGMLTKIGEGISQFYQNRQDDRLILYKVLSEWIAKKEYFETAIKKFDKTGFGKFLQDFWQQNIPLLNHATLYSKCLIHGDLHTDNIMINHNVVFIDFARSAPGPIAVDAAKLFSDIVFRTMEFQTMDFEQWDKGNFCNLSKKIERIFHLKQNDVNLVNYFIIFEFAKALSYDELASGTKEWIIRSLSKIRIDYE